MHQLYSHAVLCWGSAASRQRFPSRCQTRSSAAGEFAATIFPSVLAVAVRAPALPRCRGRRCVCAGGIGAVREGRGGRRPSVSRLPASLHRSAAEVRPLCGFGGRVPAGASGRRERWAANKAGSRLRPPARPRAGPPRRSRGCARPALPREPLPARGGCGLGEAPGAGAGHPWGPPPPRRSRVLVAGASPRAPLRAPGGGRPRHPWGEAARGDGRGGLLRWGAGLPCPPSRPRQPKFGPGVQRAAAAGLSRAVVAGEWESKHLCAGLGAAASNGFDGAVVVCCLENLHSAPCPRGAAAPQTVAVPKYNRLAPWGEVRAGGSRAARPASCFVSDLRFMHFSSLLRLGLCVGRDWRNREIPARLKKKEKEKKKKKNPTGWMSQASLSAGEAAVLAAGSGIPPDREASACSCPAAAGGGAGRASLLALVLSLLPVDAAGLARAPLCRRGASAFQRSLVGSAGQTCPSVGAGGGCSSPQQRCLESGAIPRQVCRRACFQRRAVNTAQSSFPSEIIFQLGVLGRGTCAQRRRGPQLAGGSRRVPGPWPHAAEPRWQDRRTDGRTAGRPGCRGALLLAGCSHPALPLSLLLGERHFAVDCNFIMSQVPNMPLANKRQSRAAIYFFLPPPGNQTFPSVLNRAVHAAGEQEGAGPAGPGLSGLRSGEG